MRLRIDSLLAISACALAAACGSTAEDTTLKSGGAQSSSGSAQGGGGASSSSEGSGGSGGAVVVDNGAPSDIYPAFEPVPPHAATFGGPVLAAPKIYPIFFANDDPALTAKAADFYSKIGATAYWKATTAEYGVGPATGEAPIQLTEPAPTTIDDEGVQAWLAGKLNSDDPAFPVPDKNTVLVIDYPTGSTITLGGGDGMGSASCVDFGGYHSNITLDAAHGAMPVAYAVIPRCQDFDGFSGIDAVTAAASHELVEAATDPYPMTDPAYAQIDDGHYYWIRAFGGGETADLCAQQLSSFTKFAELDYVVQRSWSNKSAKALHDPCVPALPGLAYFNSAPVLPDTVTTSFGGQSVKVQGVKILLGETRDIEIDLFSDGPTAGPWTVEAKDMRALLGQPAALELALDRTSGVNGEKLHLSTKVLIEGKKLTETFLIVSTLGKQKNLWLGIVGSDPAAP